MNKSTNADAPEGGSQTQEGRCTCPVCEALASFKSSELSQHLQAMGREGMLAARCALDWGAQKMKRTSSAAAQPENPDTEGE
jgi:hypothetical protein